MTAQRKPIPVDDKDVDNVEESAWSQDNTMRRFYDRLRDEPCALARYEEVLAEINEHQATLAQVRQAKSLTQLTLARLLEMDQSEVSRLERRSDMLLSTLRSFIQAAGGELQLIATFPDSTPVQLLVGQSVQRGRSTGSNPRLG